MGWGTHVKCLRLVLAGLLVVAALSAPHTASAQAASSVFVLPDGSVAPSVAMSYQRSRRLGRAGTATSLLAWPVVLVGVGFIQSETRFSVASGRALVGIGLVAAVGGVPLMLHAGSQGARTLRLARPEHSSSLIRAGAVFHGISVVFGTLTAVSFTADWGNRFAGNFLRSPVVHGVVSGTAGLIGFMCAKAQLDNNLRLVRLLDGERARAQWRRGNRTVRVALVPAIARSQTGLSLVGEF